MSYPTGLGNIVLEGLGPTEPVRAKRNPALRPYDRNDKTTGHEPSVAVRDRIHRLVELATVRESEGWMSA